MLFCKCSRSNSHRQLCNGGLFNAISRKITPLKAGVIRANKVNKSNKSDHINYLLEKLKASRVSLIYINVSEDFFQEVHNRVAFAHL